MKIIALYGVLQEELNINFLKISITSLYDVVDEIVILFDTPNNQKKLKTKFFKKKKIRIFFSKRKIKKTNSPVSELLDIGRKYNGTHFVFLDADEAITHSLSKSLKKDLEQMKKGDKIVLSWLAMWKKHNYFRVDKKSLWSNLYKDFIYCDNHKDKFKEYYHDYSRTPGKINKKNVRKINAKYGGIMHFQFVNWSNYQYKQAWNMCHTLTLNNKRIHNNTVMTANKINRMYFYTYFENFPRLEKIKNSEIKHIPNELFKNLYKDNSEFWHNKFKVFFKKNNIEKFEQLNIWHLNFLKRLFFEKLNRFPKKNLNYMINHFFFLLLEIFRNFKRLLNYGS